MGGTASSSKDAEARKKIAARLFTEDPDEEEEDEEEGDDDEADENEAAPVRVAPKARNKKVEKEKVPQDKQINKKAEGEDPIDFDFAGIGSAKQDINESKRSF